MRKLITLSLPALLFVGYLWSFAQIKPLVGARLNTALSIYPTMIFSYGLWTLTDTEPFSGQATKAGTSNPTVDNDATYGQGYANNGTAGRDIDTQLATNGWSRNRSTIAVFAVVRVDGLPASGFGEAIVSDAVADATTSRLFVGIFNNVGGTVNSKFEVAFRTGTSGSTRRDINAGSGGTTISTPSYHVIGYDHDSGADVYTLYVDGAQEAQITTAESAFPNTAPFVTPRILDQGGSAAGPWNGAVFYVGLWSAPLGATMHAALAANPWIIFGGGRHRVTGALHDFDIVKPVNATWLYATDWESMFKGKR